MPAKGEWTAAIEVARSGEPSLEADSGGADTGQPDVEGVADKRLMTPEARKAAVMYVVTHLGRSIRKACDLVVMSRVVHAYVPCGILGTPYLSPVIRGRTAKTDSGDTILNPRPRAKPSPAAEVLYSCTQSRPRCRTRPARCHQNSAVAALQHMYDGSWTASDAQPHPQSESSSPAPPDLPTLAEVLEIVRSCRSTTVHPLQLVLYGPGCT